MFANMEMVVDRMLKVRLNLILMLREISNDSMMKSFEDDYSKDQRNVNERTVQDEKHRLNF